MSGILARIYCGFEIYKYICWQVTYTKIIRRRWKCRLSPLPSGAPQIHFLSSPISIWSSRVFGERPLCVNINIARSIEVNECEILCIYEDS